MLWYPYEQLLSNFRVSATTAEFLFCSPYRQASTTAFTKTLKLFSGVYTKSVNPCILKTQRPVETETRSYNTAIFQVRLKINILHG